MKRKMISALMALALLLASAPALGASDAAPDLTALYKNRDVNGAFDAATVTAINLDAQSGGRVSISQAGDYLLSGSLRGQIVIEAERGGCHQLTGSRDL